MADNTADKREESKASGGQESKNADTGNTVLNQVINSTNSAFGTLNLSDIKYYANAALIFYAATAALLLGLVLVFNKQIVGAVKTGAEVVR